MQHYLPLARKYRPQTFEDVVGQEHVTLTLKRSIEEGKIHHAYLLCGNRGVGKTSMARIIAKSINCPNRQGATPCCKCEVCEAISSGNDLDVIEIDGASNSGVDDVRALRETVKFQPARAPYKIYIIDEVHMLSRSAFNALLKTLEEPPPHVKFIFATTEANQLPDTIISRCQQYDFKNIQVSDIVRRLEKICTLEGYTFERLALEMIARNVQGGMRDSQSRLDQVMAAADKNQITQELVMRFLGYLSDDALEALAGLIEAGEAGPLLRQYNEMVRRGMGPDEILDQLTLFFRELLLLKTGGFIDGLEAERQERKTRLAANWPEGKLLSAVTLLLQSQRGLLDTLLPEFYGETVLLKLARLDDLQSLIKLARSGGGAEPAAATGPMPAGSWVPRGPMATGQGGARPQPVRPAPSAPPTYRNPAERYGVPQAPAQPQPPVRPMPPPIAERPAMPARPTPPPPPPQQAQAPVAPAPLRTPPPVAAPRSIAAPAPLPAKDPWDIFFALCREVDPRLLVFFQSQFQERKMPEGDLLTIVIPVYYASRVQEIRRRKDQLEEMLREAFGRTIRIAIREEGAPETRSEPARPKSARVLQDEDIRYVGDLFQARILDAVDETRPGDEHP